jgi:PAS domain-containing protein
MDYHLKELLDVPRLKELLASFEALQEMPSSILDRNGALISATSWQDLCARFHRANKVIDQKCVENEKTISNRLDGQVSPVVWRCPMGLVCAAMPIVLDGKAHGNVFVGQVFTGVPDKAFFMNQARLYGFDEPEYLAAIERVPIFSEERLRKNLLFIHGLTQMLAEHGLQRKLNQETEKNLREAEWKFKALFENGPIGVAYHRMIYDESGKAVDYYFLDANNKYVELTGVDPRGKTVLQAFPGIERDSFNWIGTFEKVARNGETLHFEQYLQTNDRWYECVSYQYRPDHFVVAFQETTARRRSEELLRERDRMISLLLDSTAEGIFGVDRQVYCTLINQAAIELLGIDDPGQYPGSKGPCLDDLLIDDVPVSEEGSVINRALATNKPLHNENGQFLRPGSPPAERLLQCVADQG